MEDLRTIVWELKAHCWLPAWLCYENLVGRAKIEAAQPPYAKRIDAKKNKPKRR